MLPSSVKGVASVISNSTWKVEYASGPFVKMSTHTPASPLAVICTAFIAEDCNAKVSFPSRLRAKDEKGESGSAVRE